MKTYVLTVSRYFPKTHKKSGQETYFVDKIQASINDVRQFRNKIHTIRANYELWAKRISEVQKGDAILSVRYWSGKPYNSKQIEICQLDKNSGIGIQALIFPEKNINNATVCGNDFPKPTWYKGLTCIELSKNDGLSLDDFKEWFKKYNLSNPMAIIHFTSFRY